MNQTNHKIMPVMMAPQPRPSDRFRLQLWHGGVLAGICVLAAIPAFAAADPARASIGEVLIRWMPLLLKGFVFNVIISVSAMAIGTLTGAALGLGQISLNRWVRNSPGSSRSFFATRRGWYCCSSQCSCCRSN